MSTQEVNKNQSALAEVVISIVHASPSPELLALIQLSGQEGKRPENITQMNLSHKGIITLPSDIGLCLNLEHLHLGNNQLTSLPAEIGNLQKLRVIYLRGNQLTFLPAEIANLKNLTHLHLGNNQFTREQILEIKSWIPNCIIVY